MVHSNEKPKYIYLPQPSTMQQREKLVDPLGPHVLARGGASIGHLDLSKKQYTFLIFLSFFRPLACQAVLAFVFFFFCRGLKRFLSPS